MLPSPVAAAIYPPLRLRALQLTGGDAERAGELVQRALLALVEHGNSEWTAASAGRYGRLVLRTLAVRRFQD